MGANASAVVVSESRTHGFGCRVAGLWNGRPTISISCPCTFTVMASLVRPASAAWTTGYRVMSSLSRRSSGCAIRRPSPLATAV